MAYRRMRSKTWSRRPSPRFGARRSFALKQPSQIGSGRWQWGNFMAGFLFQADQLETTNIFLELASMDLSHFNDPLLLDNIGIVQGVTQQSMIKGIDIGGIQWSSGIHNVDTGVNEVSGMPANRWHMTQMLCYDHRDNVTGVPQAINQDLRVSTFPTNVVNHTIPRPDLNQEIRDYPARIIYRTSDYYNPSVQAHTGIDEFLYATPRTEIYSSQRHRNLRLRKRLTDDWGLYYVFAVHSAGTTVNSRVFYCWVTGSIYYKIAY